MRSKGYHCVLCKPWSICRLYAGICTSPSIVALPPCGAAVVREAAAGAVADMLDGESAEERSAKVAAAKEARMRKVIS